MVKGYGRIFDAKVKFQNFNTNSYFPNPAKIISCHSGVDSRNFLAPQFPLGGAGLDDSC